MPVAGRGRAPCDWIRLILIQRRGRLDDARAGLKGDGGKLHVTVIDEGDGRFDWLALQECGEEGEVIILCERFMECWSDPIGWQRERQPTEAKGGRLECQLIVVDHGTNAEAADAMTDIAGADGQLNSSRSDVNLRKRGICRPVDTSPCEPLLQAGCQPSIDGFFANAQSPHISLWPDLLELFDETVFGGFAEF